MGCKQVKVIPSDTTNDIEVKKVQATVSETNITPSTSGQIDGQPATPNINPLSVLVSATNTVADRNDSEQSTQPQESVTATTLNPKGGDNTVVTDYPNKFSGLSPTPNDPKETVVYRQNILRRRVSNVDTSDFPEDNSMTIKSNDSEETYSRHRSFSSSVANSEMRTHGQYAIQRFISARPSRPTNQESTHHGNWSEQDDSYSLRGSLASGVSADSEGSVVDLPRSIKNRHVHPMNLNFKQKTFGVETSDDSDGSDLQHVTDTNSMTIDVHMMTERLVSNLRSASTKLSNRDFQSRGAISETTSESDEK